MTKGRSITTRRDVLAGAGYFAGLAVAAPAVASVTGETADDAAWREFAGALAWDHPNGRAAAENARAHGMNLAELYSVTLQGFPPEELPVLTFGDAVRDEVYVMVGPNWCGEYRRARRGSGPDLTDELRKLGVGVR